MVSLNLNYEKKLIKAVELILEYENEIPKIEPIYKDASFNCENANACPFNPISKEFVEAINQLFNFRNNESILIMKENDDNQKELNKSGQQVKTESQKHLHKFLAMGR
jgi:hypothetical protein